MTTHLQAAIRAAEQAHEPGCRYPKYDCVCVLSTEERVIAALTYLRDNPSDGEIEAIVRQDFIRYSLYGGYTDEVKEAEWLRMKHIEVNRAQRQIRALFDSILGAEAGDDFSR